MSSRLSCTFFFITFFRSKFIGHFFDGWQFSTDWRGARFLIDWLVLSSYNSYDFPVSFKLKSSVESTSKTCSTFSYSSVIVLFSSIPVSELFPHFTKILFPLSFTADIGIGCFTFSLIVINTFSNYFLPFCIWCAINVEKISDLRFCFFVCLFVCENLLFACCWLYLSNFKRYSLYFYSHPHLH